MEKEVKSLRLETETLRSEVEMLANELRRMSITLQNGVSEIRNIVENLYEPEHTELEILMQRVSVASVYAVGVLSAVGAAILVKLFTQTESTSVNGYLPYHPLNVSTAF